MAQNGNKRGRRSIAAVAGSLVALAAGLMAAVLLTNQSAAATASTCQNAGGDGQHYVLGPCGYDKGNDSLIVAGSTVPTLGDGDHVVICHALGEDNKDTYIQIAPSTGVVFGHAGSGHQLGQDIIPPFKYVSNSGNKEDDSLQYGQNWDAAHIAIYNNGCAPPTSSTTTTGTTTTGQTTTTSCTCGTTTVYTTTTVPGGTTTVTTPGQTTTVTTPGTTVTTPTQTVTTPGQTVTNTQTVTVTSPTQTVTVTTPGPTQTVTNTVTTTTPGKTKVIVRKKVIVHTRTVIKKVKVPTKGHLAYTK